MPFKHRQFENWFNQALNTLKSAQSDLENKFFNWSCFKSQQAAEYAIKAIINGLGISITGHTLLRLTDILKNNINDIEFDRKCIIFLDKLYIPTRYADTYDDGAPFDFYTEDDCKKAIKCVEKIHLIIQTFHDKILEEEKKTAQVDNTNKQEEN